MDYLHWDKKFNNICVWDFVAQVDSEKQEEKNKSNSDDIVSNGEDDDDNIDDSKDKEELEKDMSINETEKNMDIKKSPPSPSIEDVLWTSLKKTALWRTTNWALWIVNPFFVSETA